jgi:hypothetical protein
MKLTESPFDCPTTQQHIQLVHSKGQFNLSYYFGIHYTQGQAQI